MNLRKIIPVTALSLLLFAPRPGAAQAGLTVTLTPSVVRVASPVGGDQVFMFSGTLTNNFTYALYLNGDLPTVDPPLLLNDTKFVNAFVFPTDPSGNLLPQPTLAAGSSETVALFDVTVPAGTPAGVYGGTFEIQGGAGAGDFGLLAAPTFTFNAAPVPEASTDVSLGLLLAAGFAGSIVSIRRRKTRVA